MDRYYKYHQKRILSLFKVPSLFMYVTVLAKHDLRADIYVNVCESVYSMSHA